MSKNPTCRRGKVGNPWGKSTTGWKGSKRFSGKSAQCKRVYQNELRPLRKLQGWVPASPKQPNGSYFSLQGPQGNLERCYMQALGIGFLITNNEKSAHRDCYGRPIMPPLPHKSQQPHCFMIVCSSLHRCQLSCDSRYESNCLTPRPIRAPLNLLCLLFGRHKTS